MYKERDSSNNSDSPLDFFLKRYRRSSTDYLSRKIREIEETRKSRRGLFGDLWYRARHPVLSRREEIKYQAAHLVIAERAFRSR